MMDLRDIPAELLMLDSRASAVLYRFLVNRPVKKIVMLPVNICTVVPAVVEAAGYDIEYVDIAKDDLCPDKEEILLKISADREKYSCVLYNYTYGIDLDVNQFLRTLKEKYPDLLVIEDRCSNMPGADHSEFADLTLYSTGYAKQVDLNYGGIGILNKPLSEKNTKANSILPVVDGEPLAIGFNAFSMEPEKYFMGIDQRKILIVDHKRKLNAIYSNSLPKEIQLDSRFNNWRFHIKVSNKEVILKKIFAEGLFASSHFAPLGEDLKAFPVATDLHNRIINLFNDLYFTEEKATAICKLISTSL